MTVMNVPKFTYATHYYCMRGCGPDKGWFEHGKEKLAKNGCVLCPFCGTHMRTKSRFMFGIHRAEDPPRL